MSTLFDSGDVTLVADDTNLVLSGQPDFDSAAELTEAGRKWLGQRSDGVSIDLCGVASASTATLSILLEWQRHLALHSGHVDHLSLSPALHRLTAVSGLESLLPALDKENDTTEVPVLVDTF